jgi:predicted Zn finger-like uncharacterized protein
MRIHCEKCSAAYSVKDDLLSDEALGVQCPYCTHVQRVGGLSASARSAAPQGSLAEGLGESVPLDQPSSRGASRGLATLCQDCGSALKDEFDQLVGLCDEHQGLRRAFLGVFDSGAAALSMPRGVSALPRRNSSRVSVAPRREPPSRVGLRILSWLGLAAAIGAGLFYGQKHQVELSALLAKITQETPEAGSLKPNPLSKWLGVWRIAFGTVEGRPGDYLAKAEQLYLLDTWTGYESADDILKRALILNPKAPKAIALFVENLAIWRGSTLTAEEINTVNAALRFAQPSPSEALFIRRAHAALALSQGDSVGCREWAEQAVALAPKDARARILVASSYLDGNGVLAVSELIAAGELDPKLARVRRLLAYAYYRQGRYASALSALNKRLETAPRDGALHILGADLRLALGQLEQRRAHLQKAVAGSGNRLQANVKLGQTMLALGLAKDAQLRFNSVVHGRGASQAQKTAARLGKARASLLGGDHSAAFQMAAEVVKGAVKTKAEHQDALLVQAQAALLTKNASTALGLSELVLASRPNDLLAVSVHALSHLALRHPYHAMVELKRALKAMPKEPRLHAMLFAAHRAAGNSDAATASVLALAKIDPLDNPARQRDLRSQFGKGLWQLLRGHLKPGSKNRKDVAAAYSVLALMLFIDDDDAGATRAVKIALGKDKGQILAHLYQAQLLLKAEKYEDAEEHARTILDLDRSSAIGQLMLARVQKAKGALDEAKESYQSALRNSPGLTIAKVELAGMSLQAGDKNAALKVLTDAFRVYPGLRTTRRLLLASGY